MPYQHIEEIQSRRGEKIAAFLTVENAAGLILAALPAYLVSAGMPGLLRIVIVAGAAALGVLVTLDIGGMTLYERVLWRLRGAVRRRIASPIITADQLVGGAPLRRDRPMAVDGPVQLRPLAGSLARRARPGPPNATSGGTDHDAHLSAE